MQTEEHRDTGEHREAGSHRHTRDNRDWVKPLLPGTGLVKGLLVTLRTMLKRSITQQYPREKPELPARSRGVIALKQENCTVCYKCSRECPDWCIYIDAHKETHEPSGGGRGRSAKVLDRFDIDFALCMYCGICIEVCPFDALFWTPEFEYSEYRIEDLLHDRETLQNWTYTVLPPPELEVGAEVETEEEPAPAAVAAPAAQAEPAAPAPAAPAAAGEAPAAPRERAPRPPHVEPDQETYDRVLAEQLAKGTDKRVAEGRAKSAAVTAARKKAEEAG